MSPLPRPPPRTLRTTADAEQVGSFPIPAESSTEGPQWWCEGRGGRGGRGGGGGGGCGCGGGAVAGDTAAGVFLAPVDHRFQVLGAREVLFELERDGLLAARVLLVLEVRAKVLERRLVVLQRLFVLARLVGRDGELDKLYRLALEVGVHGVRSGVLSLSLSRS